MPTETYLEETHNAQGALTGRKITETDPQTGSTVTNMDIFEDDGTYLASQYCTLDSHGQHRKASAFQRGRTDENL